MTAFFRRAAGEVDMIDTRIPLLSQDYTHLLPKDLSGDMGLIVVGVGKARERGFKILYRFSDICDRLKEFNVNVVFVYPKGSSRQVLDSISRLSSKCRRSPAFLLDDDGHFFRTAPGGKVAARNISRSRHEIY
jgi:hypothetical protein